MNTGSPSNPRTSDESGRKSGISFTIALDAFHALTLDALQEHVDALAAEDALLKEHGWIWRQGSNFWTHPDVVGYSCTREYALNRIRLQLELSAMRSREDSGTTPEGAKAGQDWDV